MYHVQGEDGTGVKVGRRNTKWALVWGQGRDTGKDLWCMRLEQKDTEIYCGIFNKNGRSRIP